MTTFAVAADYTPNSFTTAAQVPEGQQHFTTEEELAKLSAKWPIKRFAEVWNRFAGVAPFDSLKPVKKFTDRRRRSTGSGRWSRH